jgi:hypothetical protein
MRGHCKSAVVSYTGSAAYCIKSDVQNRWWLLLSWCWLPFKLDTFSPYTGFFADSIYDSLCLVLISSISRDCSCTAMVHLQSCPASRLLTGCWCNSACHYLVHWPHCGGEDTSPVRVGSNRGLYRSGSHHLGPGFGRCVSSFAA